MPSHSCSVWGPPGGDDDKSPSKAQEGSADNTHTALTGKLTVLAAASLSESFAVKAQPKSFETNVKGVVTKVTIGEVDAGIGYVTDAKAAAATAEGIEIPDRYNVVADYPIAVLKQSANSNLAYAFLDYILGPDAQAVLAKYGFTGV